ncbi:MAG: hypothetical protein RID09_20645 [Coleofasciculus sp. G1-WW12-02]|uniref:hypothetical protein n=1 Tax=unclassified Coleofasciculus TaxID=2692782 RepID=UPI00330019EC
MYRLSKCDRLCHSSAIASPYHQSRWLLEILLEKCLSLLDLCHVRKKEQYYTIK